MNEERKPWWKRSNADHAIPRIERDHTLSSTPNHMTLLYELTIWLGAEDNTWSNSYRFVDRPEIVVIQHLIDGDTNVFEALYGCLPSERNVVLEYLDKRDREDAAFGGSRVVVDGQ